MNNDYTIAAVVRALHILKLFDDKHKRMSLTQISQRAGLTKSSVLRVLVSCESEGFVKYDVTTKQYRLGVEIFKLYNTAYEYMDIKQVAVPLIQEIVDEMNLVGHLGTIVDDQIFVVAKVWPGNIADSLAMLSRVGGIVPMHCTGIGKVLAAYSGREQRARLLSSCNFERYTENTICDRERFERELETIRVRGYAVTMGEHEPLLECITYPIFGVSHQLVAAASLTGLVHSFSTEVEQKAKQLLQRTTTLISNEMGA